MPSPAVILREILYSAILAKRDDDQFGLNAFEVRPTYFPSIQLSDLPEGGILWLVVLASDDKIISRDGTYERELPIMYAFQKKVEGDPTNATEAIDVLQHFVDDELRDAIILAVKNDDRFTVLRIEPLRDENNTIYNYMGLREANTFEAFGTVFFKTVLTP